MQYIRFKKKGKKIIIKKECNNFNFEINVLTKGVYIFNIYFESMKFDPFHNIYSLII